MNDKYIVALCDSVERVCTDISYAGESPFERATLARILTREVNKHFQPELTLQEKVYRALTAHERRMQKVKEARKEYAEYYGEDVVD